MLYVNPDADIFLFSDGHCQVRKLNFQKAFVEIVEISGEDSTDLAKILPVIWKGGITEKRFFDFFEGKYSKNQIKETLSSLEIAGILTRRKVNCSKFLQPFRINKITNRLYLSRIDGFIFLINVNSKIEAKIVFQNLLRRWTSKSDLKILENLQNGNVCIFSAKIDREEIIDLLNRKINEIVDQKSLIEFQLTRLNGSIALKEFDRFFEARKVITNQNTRWGKFIITVIRENSLISSIRKIRSEKEPFGLSYKYFSASHILTDLNGKPVDDSQLGSGKTAEEACGKALMETFERYCCQKRPSILIKAKAAELDRNIIIDPNRLAYYNDYQLTKVSDIKNYNENELYYWTEVHDEKGKLFLVPACHIYYCFKHSDFIDGKSHFWASTNGAAAHFSFEQAALSAIRELIERDAIMVWWLNRLSPPYINKSLLRKAERKIIKKIENCCYEVKILDLTLDLLPVCLAIARNKNKEQPYFFCGASCHENIRLAWRKALSELEHAVWNGLQKDVISIDAEQIYSPLDHEMYYLNPQNGITLDFLFEGREQKTFGSSTCFPRLSDLSLFLEKKGFQLFFKEITAEEIKNAELNINVIKAVIPDLIPITFGYLYEPFGLKRIVDLPLTLGLRQKQLEKIDFFKDYQPHFFP